MRALALVFALSSSSAYAEGVYGGVVGKPTPKEVIASLKKAFAKGPLYLGTQMANQSPCTPVHEDVVSYGDDVVVARALEGVKQGSKLEPMESSTGFLLRSSRESASLYFTQAACEKERADAIERGRLWDEKQAHPERDVTEQMRLAIKHGKTIYRVPAEQKDCGVAWRFHASPPAIAGFEPLEGLQGTLRSGTTTLRVHVMNEAVLVASQLDLADAVQWSVALVPGGFALSSRVATTERWLVDPKHCAD